jgi:hypothetical protein
MTLMFKHSNKNELKYFMKLVLRVIDHINIWMRIRSSSILMLGYLLANQASNTRNDMLERDIPSKGRASAPCTWRHRSPTWTTIVPPLFGNNCNLLQVIMIYKHQSFISLRGSGCQELLFVLITCVCLRMCHGKGRAKNVNNEVYSPQNLQFYSPFRLQEHHVGITSTRRCDFLLASKQIHQHVIHPPAP